MADQTLDTQGLNCPQPILRAKKAMRALAAGQTLEILATDPGAVKDFQAYTRSTGHELMQWNEDKGVFRFLLKKAG